MKKHPKLRFACKLFLRLGFMTIVLIILAALIQKNVSFATLRKLLLSFPKTELIVLLLISFLMSVTKAYRFYLLLTKNGVDISFFQTLRAYVASQALTPLPGGEAGRGVFLLKEVKKIEPLDSAGPIVIQAYLEVFAAAVIFLITGFIYRQLLVPSLIVVGLMVGFALLLTQERIYKFIIYPITKLPLIKGKRKDIFAFHDMIGETLKKKGNIPYSNLKVFLSSMASQLIGAILIFIIARHYEMDLGFFKSLAVFSAAVVTQGLGGFIPGGLGITEGGMTGVLLIFGARLPQIVPLILIYRVTTLVFYIALGLLCICIFYLKPLLFSKKHR